MNELSVLQDEYAQLKEEQRVRLGLRDQMFYLVLVVIGAISSFAMTNKEYNYALLIIPWINFITGLLYIANDQKIAAIGRYICEDLSARFRKCDVNLDPVFGWEIVQRDDEARLEKKQLQFVVEELAFVGSGLVAIIAFYLIGSRYWEFIVLSVIEIILLAVLAVQIYKYTDFTSGK